MGMKARKTKAAPEPRDRVLQVRPRGVGPEWWPACRRPLTLDTTKLHHEVEYAWSTIDPDGGWSSGFDISRAVPAFEVAALLEAWYEDHEDEPWPWEFRVLIVEPQL